MKTFKEISQYLLAGLSKTEIFEKMNTQENKAQKLAQSISLFPHPQNYLNKQPMIKHFYVFNLVYCCLLFGLFFLSLIDKNQWFNLGGYGAFFLVCLYLFQIAKCGVLNAMLAMLVFPALKTIEQVYQHLTVITDDSMIAYSKLDMLFHYLSSAFFLYSLFTVIYGIKLFRDVFEGEVLWDRMKWDKENQKPVFVDKSELPAMHREQSENKI